MPCCWVLLRVKIADVKLIHLIFYYCDDSTIAPPPPPPFEAHVRLLNGLGVFQPLSMARVLLLIIPGSCYSRDNLRSLWSVREGSILT